jgi:hypothetical protein
MASPISNMTRNRTTPVIQPDLHFHVASLDKVSLEETLLDEDQAEPVTTAIEFEQVIAPQQFALDGNQPSGSRGVPEPPPGELIVIGLSLLGIIALWRWAHRHRRRVRRRNVVRMREITAER